MSTCIGDGNHKCPFPPGKCPFAAARIPKPEAGEPEAAQREPDPAAANPRPVGWGRLDEELRANLPAGSTHVIVGESRPPGDLEPPGVPSQVFVVAITRDSRSTAEIHVGVYNNWKPHGDPKDRSDVYVHLVTNP